ncbi:uncharacterized protein [Cicer arietinum]|uniref:Uncharacterized protein LOC101493500 isoform X2 n=1 Tax=Cicer arietinum TaxID=3827 RepID=A0A1S3E3P3_CICAR|nr:uncharacterized protein LOC101493500 isoform X2 [Cicer arietinum]
MAIKLHHNNFPSLSSSNSWFSKDQRNAETKVLNLHCQLLKQWKISKKRCFARNALFLNSDNVLVGYREYSLKFYKPWRKVKNNLLFSSSDDGLTVNEESQGSSSSNTTDLEKMRLKLSKPLVDDDFCEGILQSLYDAARVFELAMKEQNSFTKESWFSTAWFGVDRIAWEKTLSYQAAVYSLLQAASEFSSQSDGRDKNVNVFVQRSLLRLLAPLESLIREKLSAKQPKAHDWFWSKQVPAVVASFINKFEGSEKNTCRGSSSASDVSLLMLVLTCISVILKVGPAKLSCSQFFSMRGEITGSLLDMLVDLIPISQAYSSVRDAGLCREFFVHFGPRAAACGGKIEGGSPEVVFWVNIAQRQLQKAIDKERIWSRLTTSESIEVLEKDLAIFGFFIALGRSTRSFLLSKGFNTLDDPVEDFIRYLSVGSVLYYPELSSISSYQLYVEVVCEELDWFPFYPGISSSTKQLHMHKSKQGPPNAEAVPQALDVCSHWMQSFIKCSTWLESPSNVKAAKYLSKGHKKLMECMEVEILKDKTLEISTYKAVERSSVRTTEKVSDSFAKDLKNVEDVVLRLENLLQELYVSSASCGKENLKAAYSVLEKIRKLKKEAEFLEASFRAKEDSLPEGVNVGQSQNPVGAKQECFKAKSRNKANVDRSKKYIGKSQGFGNDFVRDVTRKPDMDASDNNMELSTSNEGIVDPDPNETHRFEHLRNELVELERRVQRSTYKSENDEELVLMDGGARYSDDVGVVQMVQVQKEGNIIKKYFSKLQETGRDVWQGTQLLAIDAAAAMGLLRRTLIGNELTEKEKKTLKRTFTDMASVIPIGVLMLLPVTAVGHAAMLAAIKKYVPALIPSTYAPERLDILRQLEKMKQMTTSDVDSDEEVDEVN